jgi:type II secretion system protein G
MYGISKKINKREGFTLIELLVVIAIISLLSSVILASLQSVRAKARDATRKSDLLEMRKAVELYYSDHGSYPSTAGSWWGVAANGGSRPTSGPTGYIPGLAPTYIPVLPTDPLGVVTAYSGYLYRSDGTNYKILAHQTGPESNLPAGDVMRDWRGANYWSLCNTTTGCSY